MNSIQLVAFFGEPSLGRFAVSGIEVPADFLLGLHQK